MTPLRLRLERVARASGSPQPIVEKDYALGYLLAGLASVPALAEALVLKGGTALKKLYFGDYRFSEDLDYSSPPAPHGEELESLLRQALATAAARLGEQGPFRLELARYQEREPHPGSQEAFTIHVQFPWHPQPLCRVKLEISHDEPVLLAPDTRSLIHGYEEELSIAVRCYRLEEVVAEKLRALLQTQQRLAARGWCRARCRDYYDLWRVLGEFGGVLDRESLPALLARKCAHRGVAFESLASFFPERLMREVARSWARDLGPFLPVLPAREKVLDELRALLREHLLIPQGS